MNNIKSSLYQSESPSSSPARPNYRSVISDVEPATNTESPTRAVQMNGEKGGKKTKVKDYEVNGGNQFIR